MVFDLDPGPQVVWADVVRAARDVRSRLSDLGFASFVKSTGGKGLHVVVPLVPDASWDSGMAFARLVSEGLVAEDSRRYTTNMTKAGREAKILIDYFRNNRGATSVAAYSTRAHARGAGLRAAVLGGDRRRFPRAAHSPWPPCPRAWRS